MVSLALIFVLLLLLRYSRQRYCQEFRIDLPEIFQKKYKNEEINSTLEDDFKLQMYTSYSSDNDTVDMVNKCQEERVNVKGRHDFVDGHHAEKSNADYEIISSKSSDAVHKIEEHPSLKSSLTDSGVTDLNNVVHTPTSNSSFEQIIKMASQESLNSVWAQNSDPSDEVIEMKLDLQKEVVEVDKFSDKGETDSLLPSGYAKITYMKCYACDDNMKHCEENECRELDRTAINLTPVCSANGCRCPEKVELISEYVT
ncbi:uncharacterized protein LOC133184162 [Saccostrea echinata]|uniref:uncharacterized protein LOC133184162 n=1 Tax=Saccostrea echinata TaxID=191078 RepID=UPI002A81B481|nr:uncharacterized protein LOC133184162 [Saccostrea echinata]